MIPDIPKQMENGKPVHRLDLFRSDQITFLVTQSGERLEDRQLKDWTENIEKTLNRDGWEIKEPPPRSYSFPAVGVDESEGVPDEYQEERFDESFFIIVIHVKRKSDDESTKRRLLDLISRLDDQRRDLTFAGLTLQGVFPNWLVSGASDSGGTGGPGSDPVPFTGDPMKAPYDFADLKTSLDGKNRNSEKLYHEGAGVDVVILDTAPCGHDLVLAHKELESHPLVKSLLGPGGCLHLYPATYEELLRMGNTSLNKHDYPMTDHGLFVAGIVHSIVPKADIHLIEVLNPFGVGDLETIARGLEKAYHISRKQKRPLVVNCSLVLDLPHRQKKHAYRQTDKESILPSDRNREEEIRSRIDQELSQAETRLGKQHAADELRWVLALKVMCDRLGKVGRQVIAAAGNDWGNAEGPEDVPQAVNMKTRKDDAPPARYPAAFNRVVGVGALPIDAEPKLSRDKYKTSTYSNLGDKPPQTGVMTLGGESGENNGVLGLYLGEFPPPPKTKPDKTTSGETPPGGAASSETKSGLRDTKGWAWWAGTSFATPILTGAIAAVLSPAGIRTTQGAVRALYNAGIIEDKQTDAEEDVMPSTLTQSVKPAT